MGTVFTICIIAWVIYMIIKKHYPQAVLLMAGMALLTWAVFVNGTQVLAAKQSSGSAILDIFHTIQVLMSTRVAGLGLTIMS
ncbi:MAG: C4-dicarboxylate ABC transporter, partial [Acidaminococcaceae bacterium]